MEVISNRQDGKDFGGRNSHSAQGCGMKTLAAKLIDRESRPERVGPRITALRETLGLSKSQFADTVGVDRSTLSKVEKGSTGLDIAHGERIAILFGFGLDYIYRGDLSDVPLALRPQLLVNMVTYRAT